MSIQENAELLVDNVEERVRGKIVGPAKFSAIIDDEIAKLGLPDNEVNSTRALFHDIRMRRIRRRSIGTKSA